MNNNRRGGDLYYMADLLKTKKKINGMGCKSKDEEKTKFILEALGFLENQDFYWQYVMDDKFIVDFALPEKKIIIECDGKNHLWDKKQKNKDIERDSYAWKNGWTVIRLKNKDIVENPMFCKSLIKQIYYDSPE